MAERLFVVDLNLNGNKATNFRVEDYATDPSSGNFAGRLIHNTTGTDRLKMHDGTQFNAFAYTSELTSGTVTSVDLSAPNIFTVSNNPVTTSGTLTLTLATQTANVVFAGPTTGGSATPSFRALVAGDIPSLSSVYQPLDGDLTAIAALAGTSGFLKKTAADTYTLDTATYVTAASPTFTGTVGVASSIVFEGAIDDTSETTLTVTDPTADRTITLPDATGTVALLGTIALGTDTTGNYVSQVSQGTGITVSHTQGEGSTATISNAGVLSVTGTTNEIEVSGTGAGPWTGAITVGLPNDVTIGGGLTVTGDLTVNGNTTTLNTATLSVEDNTILLNNGVTGSPTLNAGIEVERGDSTNASLIWNETSDVWQAGLLGSEVAIALVGHTHATSDITSLQEFIEDTISTSLTDSGTIDFSYTDNSTSAGTITAGVILAASNPYLNTTSGLAVDISTLETKLTTDGYAKKYTTTIGNGTLQTFTVTHSLNTRAVTVQVYESASTYAQVEVEVLHTTADTITINTNNVPTSAQYTVVVVG